jgi:hypothetical protein
VSLEVESFYLFAKILLDKIARAIEFYFGPQRGLALDSHDDLVRRFQRYGQAKVLEAPLGLLTSAQSLREKVSDFRDQYIAHEKSPRTIRQLTWDESRRVKMVLTRVYPTEKD